MKITRKEYEKIQASALKEYEKIIASALKEKQEWIKKYRCGYGFCKNTANPANNGSGIPICDDCYHNGNYDGIEYYGAGN